MYYPDSVGRMHKRILRKAGLEDIRFHDLRHTFATLALQNGVDIKTLSSILGHYSAGFTLDTYAHVTDRMQREAANKIGRFMKRASAGIGDVSV
jgi:integrase